MPIQPGIIQKSTMLWRTKAFRAWANVIWRNTNLFQPLGNLNDVHAEKNADHGLATVLRINKTGARVAHCEFCEGAWLPPAWMRCSAYLLRWFYIEKTRMSFGWRLHASVKTRPTYYYQVLCHAKSGIRSWANSIPDMFWWTKVLCSCNMALLICSKTEYVHVINSA